MTTITNYLDIRDNINSFDGLCCKHRRWPWKWIGHDATVYRCPETDQLQVFESTSLNKWAGKSGVQLNPMGMWLQNYDGEVWLRRYAVANWLQNTADLDFSAFIRDTRNSSYPDYSKRDGRWKLILAALDLHLFGRDVLTYGGDERGVFCTELRVELFKHAGLMLPSTPPSHEFTPRLMWPGETFDACLDSKKIVPIEMVRIK